MQVTRPYLADISFLQPVIDAYKYGAFHDRGFPVSVMNALDSLSYYGQVRRYVEISDKPHELRKKTYTKKSPYWNKSKQNILTPPAQAEGESDEDRSK